MSTPAAFWAALSQISYLDPHFRCTVPLFATTQTFHENILLIDMGHRIFLVSSMIQEKEINAPPAAKESAAVPPIRWNRELGCGSIGGSAGLRWVPVPRRRPLPGPRCPG